MPVMDDLRRTAEPALMGDGHQVTGNHLRCVGSGCGGTGSEARKTADRLACEAWNKRMLGFQGPAQPSPALGDAINAGYHYLEVKCLGCNTIKPWRSTSCADRSPRQSMNWSDTCGAGIVHGFQGGPTSAAIWSRSATKISATIRRQHGGRESVTEA